MYRDRLAAFLRSYIHWFGANGPHVALGRSLIYRFGSAAALGLAGLVGTDLDAALIQSRATSSLRYFLTHGALTEGVLSLGWTGADPSVVQGYSGPASPYWASKAFIALLIPRTDAFWSSPLTLSAAKPPPPTPLLVQSVSDDLVVLHNHGSHDYEQVSGNTLPDSAYYSRFAYSSRTLPDAGETGILTTGVSLDGCRRSAFRGRIVDAAAGEGWASSRSVLRLLEPALPAQLGHRSGDRVYAHLPAQLQRLRDTDGHLDGLTMIGDGLAIQVVRVRSAPLSGRLRIGGWPIAMPAETIARQSSIMITGSFKDGGNGSSSMRAYLGAFGRPALATTSSGSGFPVLVSKSVRRNDDIMLVYGMALRADHGQIAWPDVRFASSLLTVAFSTHETSVLVCAGPLHVER